jgi:hypothetical protein
MLIGTLNMLSQVYACWMGPKWWLVHTQMPNQSILPQLRTLCQSCISCTLLVSHSGPTWLILCILKLPDLLRLQLLSSDASSDDWT